MTGKGVYPNYGDGKMSGNNRSRGCEGNAGSIISFTTIIVSLKQHLPYNTIGAEGHLASTVAG